MARGRKCWNAKGNESDNDDGREGTVRQGRFCRGEELGLTREFGLAGLDRCCWERGVGRKVPLPGSSHSMCSSLASVSHRTNLKCLLVPPLAKIASPSLLIA